MMESRLQPGMRCTSSAEGKVYQVVTLAKERNSGEEMVVYQQLFPPFAVYTELAEKFLEYMKEIGKEEFVSQKTRETDCETSRETMRTRETNCETSCETAKTSETSCETAIAASPEEEPGIHPQFRRFLDAKGNEERIEVLKGMRDIVDNTMINSMAVLLDTEIKDGPIGDRFDELLEFMQMKGRYEIERY